MSNTRQQWLEPLVHEHLDWLLEQNSGNVTAAARQGGIPLRTFRYWMDKVNVDPKRYRNKEDGNV